MVPALACIKWFDCHLPGAVVSQGTSRPNAENCSGFPPPTRQSASIEAELLGLTSIYSELFLSDFLKFVPRNNKEHVLPYPYTL